jgi:hypothetical protein
MKKIEFTSYLDGMGLNRIRVRLMTDSGALKEVGMTNKETIERNIGLTFDFVNHLIDNGTDVELLPEEFTVEFVEKDFPKLQRRRSGNQAAPNPLRKRVRVKNSFETV